MSTLPQKIIPLIFVLSSTNSQQITVGEYTFTIGNGKMTWFEAQTWCTTNSDDLVSIHSETQYNAIISAINQTNPTQNYWTGLKREGINPHNISSYTWSDGSDFDYGTQFAQFPWHSPNPNSADNPSCVRLTHNYDHKWDDLDCNSQLNGVKSFPLCAVPKQPTQSPSNDPTKYPTQTPIISPTQTPTKYPTKTPIISSTQSPTNIPTNYPSQTPTIAPTATPTGNPIPEHADSVSADIETTDTDSIINDNDLVTETESIIDMKTMIFIATAVYICCLIVMGIILLKKELNKRDTKQEYTPAQVDDTVSVPSLKMSHEHVKTHSHIDLSELDHNVHTKLRASIDLQDDEIYGKGNEHTNDTLGGDEEIMIEHESDARSDHHEYEYGRNYTYKKETVGGDEEIMDMIDNESDDNNGRKITGEHDIELDMGSDGMSEGGQNNRLQPETPNDGVGDDEFEVYSDGECIDNGGMKTKR